MIPKEDNIVVGFESVNFICTPDGATKERILDNESIIKDIAIHVKSEIQNAKKTTTLKYLHELLRGRDYEV